VIGGYSLTRFATGQELFDYILTRMPFHAPGILGAENYWALTAFLLDAHRIPYTGQVLNATTAGSIRLRQAAAPVAGALDWRAGVLLGAGLVGLAGFGVWRRATRKGVAGRQASGPK
jgi:hypothetical protein